MPEPCEWTPPGRATNRRYPMILDRLAGSDMERFLARCTRISVGAGQGLTSQGQVIAQLHIVLTGRVRAYFAFPSGASITFCFWLPGMIIGMRGLTPWGQNFHWSTEAAEDSELLRITQDDYNELASEIPALARAHAEVMEFKALHLMRLVRLLATPSTSSRLCIALLSLCQHCGVDHPDGVLIDARFTQSDLAEMVGASRQWVSTTLGRLQREGLITMGRNRILVRDTAALDAYT